MKRYLLIGVVLGLGFANAQEPAAKVHVRQHGTSYVKYTSKLKGIVELNFTMNFHHNEGKGPTTSALKAAGAEYGFTVHSITGAGNGSQQGSVPNFGLDDLVDNGQVIVANNISAIGNANVGSSRQSAIQQAIETKGMGYLGTHGSGDNEASGWPWFSNVLYPVDYAKHGNRSEAAPVYKNPTVAKHVVLENVLETVVSNAIVPNELDNIGNEKLSNLPTRNIRAEWYQYNNLDFCPDGPNKEECLSRLTTLLKYDPRSLTNDALKPQYRRKGGNLFTYVFKVGQGMTSYFPQGHFQRELDDFDKGEGGVTSSGDLKRYLGQLLMYLAGYELSVCNDANPCLGLPIVDGNGVMVDDTVSSSSHHLPTSVEFRFSSGTIGFYSKLNESYNIQLMDISGNVLDEKQGGGNVNYSYTSDALKKGVYFLKVQYPNQKTQIKRYAILSN